MTWPLVGVVRQTNTEDAPQDTLLRGGGEGQPCYLELCKQVGLKCPGLGGSFIWVDISPQIVTCTGGQKMILGDSQKNI